MGFHNFVISLVDYAVREKWQFNMRNCESHVCLQNQVYIGTLVFWKFTFHRASNTVVVYRQAKFVAAFTSIREELLCQDSCKA